MPRKRRADESREEYIEYCMSDEQMISEYPNNKQRIAVCAYYARK